MKYVYIKTVTFFRGVLLKKLSHFQSIKFPWLHVKHIAHELSEEFPDLQAFYIIGSSFSFAGKNFRR